LRAVKKPRLTPFSGSLFRLALAMIGGVGVLAAIFMLLDFPPARALRKTTESYDDGAPSGLSRGDQRFLEHAAALHAGQVQLAELAQRQATDERVRDYATRVLATHRAAGAELGTLAQRRSATPLERMDREDAADLTRDAKNFDEAYLARMVEAHTEALDLFERAAKQCNDPELRAFAIKTVPDLQAHLAQAKQLRKSVG
jgi:putative membrane protein